MLGELEVEVLGILGRWKHCKMHCGSFSFRVLHMLLVYLFPHSCAKQPLMWPGRTEERGSLCTWSYHLVCMGPPRPPPPFLLGDTPQNGGRHHISPNRMVSTDSAWLQRAFGLRWFASTPLRDCCPSTPCCCLPASHHRLCLWWCCCCCRLCRCLCWWCCWWWCSTSCWAGPSPTAGRSWTGFNEQCTFLLFRTLTVFEKYMLDIGELLYKKEVGSVMNAAYLCAAGRVSGAVTMGAGLSHDR